MCGLLTFISAHGQAPARRDTIAEALTLLCHRGPDDTGVEVIDDDAVLGFQRLSIIDVATSHQPLWYANERYALTFNGEIYNYLELRDELLAAGADFTTDGDGEVILAGYHHWGSPVVKRLRGMFAFVIWDRQERVAFGARDPFGIKPLYYRCDSEGLALASEKKALLWDGGDELDGTALSHYLSLQYVPEPRSLTAGIWRIGSGEWFSYRPGGKLRTQRYWRPEFRPIPVDGADERGRLCGDIQQALRESVRIHMRSDVPVGAFLSSGIDSTACVALAREVNPDILTFTAALSVPGYSELEVAAATAAELGVVNYPVEVTPHMVMDALPRIIWHLDDPVADPSLVPLYFVARAARQHVTVALSGEGSDELFAGYPIYREPASLRPISGLPDPLRRGLRTLAQVIPEGVKGRGFLDRATLPLPQRHVGNGQIFNPREKAAMLRRHPVLPVSQAMKVAYAEATGLAEVHQMQYVDLYTWLRGDILAKADRMSMANSLEVRVPFLDYGVFDVAARVPVEWNLPPRTRLTKAALRRALMGVVPPAIVNRPKLGFPTPTRAWLAGPMYEWTREAIATSGADELLDLRYPLDLLAEHRAGTADHSRKIWTTLVFCLWYALFVERSIDVDAGDVGAVGAGADGVVAGAGFPSRGGQA